MALKRLDNALIVVEDLEAAKAFFLELGMVLEGAMPIEGRWVDRCIGIDGTRAEIVMLRTPDGHGRVELDKFHAPKAIRGEPAPVNTLGLRRLMFAVDDLDDTLRRLRPHGAELVGEVVQYEDFYRLCYVRGPEGLILGLAEELRPAPKGHPAARPRAKARPRAAPKARTAAKGRRRRSRVRR